MMNGRQFWQLGRGGRQQAAQLFDHVAQAVGGTWYPQTYPGTSQDGGRTAYSETYADEQTQQQSYNYSDVYTQLHYYSSVGGLQEQQYGYNQGYYPYYQQQMYYPQIPQYPMQYLPQQTFTSSSVVNQERQRLVGTDADVYAATSHFNRWLTKRITETSTPRELLLLIQQKGRFFDKVHLAAGYVQAARLFQNKNVNTDIDSINMVVEQLCLRSTPEMLRLMDGWTLSNTMWGLVKTKFHTSNLGRAVARFLVAEVARKAETFKSQELSITAWSLARMNIRSENVLNEISRVALQRKRKLGAQAISNILWAFASLNQYDQELFEALVVATADSFEEFDPQGLSNVMWALAHMGHYDERFLFEVCEFLCRVENRQFSIFPVGLTQIVVALGRLNFKHEKLLDRIIAKMVSDFGKIDQQCLCNTFFYWAVLQQDFGKLHSLVQEIVERYEKGGVEAFSSADLQRIYEGVQLFECQGLKVDLPEELWSVGRQELLQSYQKIDKPPKVNEMIQEVSNIVTKLGESPKTPQLSEDPVYEIPIGVQIDGKPIAIFAVGSRMYSCTKPYRKMGLMEAKQNLLKHYGWKIVDVPMHDWERLDSVLEQENYLKRKLNLALSEEVRTGAEMGDTTGRIVDLNAQ